MRDIKFRGKDINTGQWVYGYLSEIFTDKGFEQRYEIDCCRRYTNSNESIDVYEVDPKTVGQYTGFKDKNGVEIYEGVVIKIIDIFGFRIGKIIWKETKFVCSLESGGENVYSDLSVFTSDDLVILGNIYDNPELLEVK